MNAELIETAIIEVDGKLATVVDMDEHLITVKISDSKTIKISNDSWSPIFLDNDWLSRLNASVGMKIKNTRTKDHWTIRKQGTHYYLTVDSDISLGENPMIPINFVHSLQEWYYRPTGTYLPSKNN